MRKHWIDNLRWVTVLLVLLYHVFYFYNNKGVIGGIGGFGDGPQYQDAIMYILYPWFMPLLFILAGISARYALQNHPAAEWFKDRTRKLLVPSTIGLLFIGAVIGWINTMISPAAESLSELPLPVKYFIWVISGTGPFWFIQDLWLLSLALLLIRKLDPADRFYNWCGRLGTVPVILLGVLFWLGHKTLIMEPYPASAEGLWNLYKPVFYMVPFLMGYFVFAHERIQENLRRAWGPLMICAEAACITLIFKTFGQDNTLPAYLASPLNNIYGWLMCLAMMGWFKARFDRTGKFAGYMTRTSYGIYIVHYLVIASVGFVLKTHTSMQPACIYIALTAAVFILSPLLYEIIRRIPFLRWCVLGMKRPSTKS
jgi:surface polysaccharide O-acyltransferase-like enzyme